MAIEEEAGRGRPLRAGDDIGQAPDAGGDAAPDGSVENPLGHFHDPFQVRSSPRQHDARAKVLLQAQALQVLADQPEELFGAGLQDVGERRAGAELGRAPADHRDFDHLVLAHRAAERAPVLLLDPLRVRDRRPQDDGEVVGEVIAADWHHGRVDDRALLVDGDLGRAPPDVHEGDAELLLVLRQDGFRGRELLENELHDLDARLVGASHDVLCHRHGRRHDVHFGFEARADHPDRIRDAVLPVHGELPRDDVDDLVVLRDLDSPGRVDDARDVFLRDLTVLARHRDHAAAVEGAHVGAGGPDPGPRDLHAGHDFRLFRGPLDGLDRRVHIDDIALAGPAVGRRALADDVERAVGVLLTDQDADLGSPDVAGDQEILRFRH